MEPALWSIRLMFGIAVVGAGAVGLLVLVAPAFAQRYIFVGAAVVTPYLRIVGALWLALGVVAALGLFSDPLRFSPVLLIQLIYKIAWLLIVALPALARGSREPALIFLALLFTAWSAALLAVVPFGYLLSS